ncbi:LOW QUALITY PROTEIN: protein EARLY FLOWERING 3 [Sesamum indicum]|uniref:LOW QUALITY PROTEIN: protein EARLY FLOWERING 3 n=1 Tax=Sesamum indicum TaxID=4182 RepID=A0A6I9TBC0_SESIN|nr:LOW QUALITY PROTEIN: protein EARLY FLOWERING 3 [Sesamum indicum]
MKRGKDEEKMMGPMFPRLHVNDTEKGGPRAPPRNKMALYEQLSIPSQRFSHPVMPCDPSNSAANLVPRLSQGGGNDRGMCFSRQVPPGHPSENQYSQYSDFSTSSPQLQQRKKLNEGDYSVPVFVHSIASQEFDKYSINMDRERLSSSNPHIFDHSLKSQDAEETGMNEHSTRQEGNNQKRENSKEVVVGWVKAISNSSSTDKQTGCSLIHESRDEPSDNIDRLKTDNCVRPELCAESQPSSNRQCNAALRKNTISVARRNSSDSNKGLPSEDQNLVHGVSNDTESSEDGSCRSPQMNNLEKGDSVSETSVLDTISGLDITPDDVVSMIGQKHFWKARRALVNQQRLFAVQVFELHRLIKVQKLISASPHVLLEDSGYLGKPLKPLHGKKLPLGCAVKAIPNVSKQKGDTEKPSHKKEGSAENTVEKASISSAQNGGLPSSCGPLSANSPAPSVNQSWCFNQPQGPHQWLIPVMSPSEGLVYKPYPGPGFMGQPCAPPASNPMMGNILTPYGLPAPPPQYQLPSFPPVGPHGYLPPPYGMPIMNTAAFSGSSVEQMNPPATLGRFSGGEENETNFINQHHNLFTSPSQKNGAVPDDINLRRASKDIDMQASTGSSPIERRSGSQASNNLEGRNMLPLFPTSGAISASKSTPQVATPERQSRVIKVIPHNALSASESAARIFRSIQEERKQYDSM